MPEFYIKKGLADVLLTEWIKEHQSEPFIRVNIEVESPKKRLQGAFHALLKAWYNSGEYSVEVKTEEKLKRYYKFVGCNWEVDYYMYKGEEYKDSSKLFDDYPNAEINDITKFPRHFMSMTKKQICGALDGMIVDINNSRTNNQKVLYSLSLITNDVETLNWLKWDKYQKDKNKDNYVENIKNKFT